MMTVREVITKIELIEHIFDEIKRESKDLDYDLICDILDEYRDVLLDKTVK